MLSLPDQATVIGAGIGGLAAAVLLARSGRRVTVLERGNSLGGSGFGIQITPNGTAVLRGLGVRSDYQSLPAHSIEICSDRPGPALFRQQMSFNDSARPPYLLYRRSDLVRQLRQLAAAEGVNFVFNARVAQSRLCSDRVDCVLADGTVHSTPYLIAADGADSPTRRQLNETACRRQSRHQAWRAFAERQRGKGGKSNVIRLTVGACGHLVTYPIGDGTILNVVAVKEADRGLPLAPPRTASRQELLGEFGHFGTGVRRVLERCGQADVWTLPDSCVAENWFSSRAVLIGDALHPMQPFLAQGGNMALEDAWILCRALLASSSLDEAHAAFRRRREERIRRTVRAVELQGRLYHAKAAAVPARRILLRCLNRLAPGLIWSRMNWLFGHDVTSER